MKLPITSPQTIKLNPSCLGQTDSIRSPGTGPGYENTEPGCILAVLRVPSIVRSPVWQGCLRDSAHLAQTGV